MCIMMHKALFPLSRECRKYIKVTDVIECVRRSVLNNDWFEYSPQKKDRSRLRHIFENKFSTIHLRKEYEVEYFDRKGS